MVKAFKNIFGYEQILIRPKLFNLKLFNLINFMLKNHRNFQKKRIFFKYINNNI